MWLIKAHPRNDNKLLENASGFHATRVKVNNMKKGGSPALVVMGGDLHLKVCGFELQHQRLD